MKNQWTRQKNSGRQTTLEPVPGAATSRYVGLHRVLCSLIVLVAVSGCGLAMDAEDRLDRGDLAFAEGDYRAAIIEAKDVLLGDPQNVRGRLLLGRASIEVGDGAAAEKELHRAMELGVDRAEVATDLAAAYLLQGKFQEVIDEIPLDGTYAEADINSVRRSHGAAYMGLQQPGRARELFSSVVAADAGDVEARMGVVASFVAEEELARAREILDEILADEPNNSAVRLYSGSLYAQLGLVDKAEAEFRTALQLAEADEQMTAKLQAIVGLTEALFTQNKIDEARVLVQRLGTEAPDSVQAKLLSARVAYVDEDWRLARQNLQQVLRVAPGYPPAQLLLGAVQLRSGNLSQAEMYLSAAVAAAPADVNARQLLAETRLQMQKLAEAQEALDPIVSSEGADATSLQMAARASLGRQDFDAALEYLRRSVAERPDDAELQFQLATVLLQAGRSEEAEVLLEGIDVSGSDELAYQRDALKVLRAMVAGQQQTALASGQRLVEAFPTRPAAHNMFGVVHLANSDIDAAKKSFERAAELDRVDAVAQRYLGMIDESVGDLAGAESRYKQYLVDEPNTGWALFSLGRVAAQQGNANEAMDWLEQARQADPRSISARLALAQIHLAGKDIQAATELLNESLKIDDSNMAVVNLQGLIQYEDGNFRAAADAFRRAVAATPGNPEFRWNLARAETQLGNRERAIQLFEENIEASLNHLPSAMMLGMLKAETGDLKAGTGIVNQLRQRYPDSLAPYVLEGEIHAISGSLELAEAAYAKAVSMGQLRDHVLRLYNIKSQRRAADAKQPLLDYLEARPEDNTVRLVLASAYTQAGQDSEAIAAYERVVANDQSNAVALNNLAWHYFTSNDSRAIETARKAHEVMPDSSAILDTLGWILLERGSPVEGEAFLRRAVELDNSDSREEILYHHAVALARLGKKDEARDALQEVLSSEKAFASRAAAEKLIADL